MASVTPLGGLVFGLVAAIVMAVVMNVLAPEDAAPPPFAVFWAQFIGGGRPEDTLPQSMVLHAIYGSVAGLVFVLVFGAFGGGLSIDGFVGGVVWGVVWAVVLFVVAAVGWMNAVLDADPERGDVMRLGVLHLVYGLTLGVVTAAAASTGILAA